MKKRNYQPKHLYTKEEIRSFITLWDSKTKEELATALAISQTQVASMAYRIRKFGYPLVKKNKTNVLENLIKEVVAELKVKSKK